MDFGGLKSLCLHEPLVREDFLIPTYIITGQDSDTTADKPNHPLCPVIVFINSRSGGQLGGELLNTYREVLSKHQVFDLGEKAPEKVLQELYANLARLRPSDKLAEHIMDNLRLIVAGGDGTASWLLGVVCDLKLTHPPPVATVPLGTGNNLPFSFGWGKKNPGTDHRSAEQFLFLVKKARPLNIDNWHVIMRMRTPKVETFNPVPPLDLPDLPHAMHAFHRLSSSDSLNQEGHLTFRGGFWNYFSMGMDAQVSYEFHSQRKLHPEKFKNQFVNQSTYIKLGCSQGWFKPSMGQDETRSISQMAKIKVKKQANQDWEDLDIPNSIRSIVCLNLPSFSGGLNPWGTPDTRKQRFASFTPPYVDDGRIEVVGFRDAWHGLVLLSSKGHGTRLVQANRIKFEFHRGAADHTYMRLDGEPWKQPLPTGNDQTVELEISHHGQVTMLALPNCRSKSVNNGGESSNPATPLGHDSSDEESYEERRKFGAAETFKLPPDIDIAHLS